MRINLVFVLLLIVAEPLVREGVLVEDALHGVLAPFELLVLVGLEVGFVVRGAEVVTNEFRFRCVLCGNQISGAHAMMVLAHAVAPTCSVL